MTPTKIVDLLIRHRYGLLLVSVLLIAVGWIPSMQLEFERSIENLFRQDDPRYDTYRLDKRLFGGIETAIVAYDDPELFAESGLNRLADFQQKLNGVDGVRKATSLNDVRRPSALLESRKLLEQVRQNLISSEDLKACSKIVTNKSKTSGVFGRISG